MKYHYAEIHFGLQERSSIWASINSNYDAEWYLSRCVSYADSILAINPATGAKILYVDEVAVEKGLGELEIVIRRITELPRLFTYNDKDVQRFITAYEETIEKLKIIAMRRMSWD